MFTAPRLVAAALLMAGQIYGAVIVDSDQNQAVLTTFPGKSEHCPLPKAPTAILYRTFNADFERSRYTTTRPPIVDEAGFEYDAVVGRVFVAPPLGGATVPLYHLFNAATQDSFYTRDVEELDQYNEDVGAEAGYVDMGVALHLFPRRICGAVPVFRLFKAGLDGRGGHFYTMDTEERDELLVNEGYADAAIVGYALAAK
ncbi:hypothetical protein DFH06DRAFT_581052 [Mycena polygramma]|nr:hypothetical protein DFH06DRAFT_581052 [Mycena polygramma]